MLAEPLPAHFWCRVSRRALQRGDSGDSEPADLDPPDELQPWLSGCQLKGQAEGGS